MTDNYGASLAAWDELLGPKGYSLVACSIGGVNAFFVRNDLLAGKFCEPLTPENHYEPARHWLTFVSGYPPNIGEGHFFDSQSRLSNVASMVRGPNEAQNEARVLLPLGRGPPRSARAVPRPRIAALPTWKIGYSALRLFGIFEGFQSHRHSGSLGDIQRRLLLGEKKNPLTLGQGIRDDVRDGLRFSRAGRTVDHEILPAHDIDQGAVLRSIGILNQQWRYLLDLRIVDRVIVGDQRQNRVVIGPALDAAQDRVDERIQDRVLPPVLVLQV